MESVFVLWITEEDCSDEYDDVYLEGIYLDRDKALSVGESIVLKDDIAVAYKVEEVLLK